MTPLTGATCAICCGELASPVVTILAPDRFERHLAIADEGYRRSWVGCSVCGSATNVFETSRPDQLQGLEAAYYAVDLAGVSLAERFAAILAIPPHKSDNMGRVARVAGFADSAFPCPRRSVLDVGAGTGVFLYRLLERVGDKLGRVAAVESDPLAAEHLRTLRGIEVVEGSFPLRRDIGTFDLVTLNKVLEHIAEPVPFLKEVVACVSSVSGLCYVEVPDVLTAELRASDDYGLGSLHRHLYSVAGLSIVLHRAGLRTLRLERIVEPSGKISLFAFAARRQAVGQWAAGCALR